jgi:hypothetical protein
LRKEATAKGNRTLFKVEKKAKKDKKPPKNPAIVETVPDQG